MKFNAENHISVDGDKIIIEDIKTFETWRGYQLPKDFVEFTLKYPGASMSAEFDSEGRPGSMISNMLKFSKEGYSSIYVDEAYEIKDFGPYVLFGEDPGGNFIAFDYSNDELNPAVVFIDHEELGLIELSEGKTEDDYTEAELDRMMSSEKLTDFPWAIHYVAKSFNEFLDEVKFREISIESKTTGNISDKEMKEFKEQFSMELPSIFISFMKKYSNFIKNGYERKLMNKRVNLINVLSVNTQESDYILKVIESRGGVSKFPDLIPFMYINYNWNVYDFSLLCLYKKDGRWSIVIYLEEYWSKDTYEIIDNLIYLTDNLDEFFNLLIDELEKN
ncbi:SMI1/KNR4 family protein [Macrococcus capreoli]